MFKRDTIILAAVAIVVLGIAGIVAWGDVDPGYREYQRGFRELVRQKLGDERSRGTPEGVQQIWIAAIDRTDRCTSCHLGTTWSALAGAPEPFTPHSAKLLKAHPVEKFGCTLCHGGQGQAASLPAAHGWVPYWDDPLLDTGLAKEYGLDDPYAFVQIRCNGCHRYERRTEGADDVNAGKALIDQKGCRACHFINGRGGRVGPDLSRIGDKAPEQYDTSRLTSLASLYAWHVGHLQSPKSFSPTTVMPDFGFTSTQAHDVALVLLSWRDVRVPPEYLPGVVLADVPTREEAEREHMMREGAGKFFVEKTCFICHDVSSLGISSATKIGPDLALAVADAPRRFGRPLEDFLHAPQGTMQVVLSRQIRLTPEELEEAIRLLHVAYDKHTAEAAKEKGL